MSPREWGRLFIVKILDSNSIKIMEYFFISKWLHNIWIRIYFLLTENGDFLNLAQFWIYFCFIGKNESLNNFSSFIFFLQIKNLTFACLWETSNRIQNIELKLRKFNIIDTIKQEHLIIFIKIFFTRKIKRNSSSFSDLLTWSIKKIRYIKKIN